MSFASDLEEWKEIEVKVMSLLNNNWFNLIQNPNKKEMDLIILEKWIEVKYCRRAKETWNFYIEYECNWNPSWIFREEKLDLEYWGHTDWETLYLIVWYQLKKFINSILEWEKIEWIKLTNWWDWWKTKWVLVPIRIIDELSIIKFNLN